MGKETGITIEVYSNSGEVIDLTLKGYNSLTLMTKLPMHMKRFVKRVEKALKLNGEKVEKKEVTFHGSWNIVVLKRFTQELDKRNVKWWLDP